MLVSPTNERIKILLSRVHQHGRHDIRWKPAIYRPSSGELGCPSVCFAGAVGQRVFQPLLSDDVAPPSASYWLLLPVGQIIISHCDIVLMRLNLIIIMCLIDLTLVKLFCVGNKTTSSELWIKFAPMGFSTGIKIAWARRANVNRAFLKNTRVQIHHSPSRSNY